jgi:predicted molibdopterin-dependent oxidoreductase YjgC
MTLRIENAFSRPPPVTIHCDGRAIPAHPGETIAAALFAAGIRTLRHSPRSGSARGMFCLMGVCQECLVLADKRRVLACQQTVHDGMRIERIGAIDD